MRLKEYVIKLYHRKIITRQGAEMSFMQNKCLSGTNKGEVLAKAGKLILDVNLCSLGYKR